MQENIPATRMLTISINLPQNINKNSKTMYFFFIENILLSLLFFLTCILYECQQKLDNFFKSSQEHR